uniref:Prenylcysteine lyase domain-containing protein n=1 Tax=Bionectria ochroleuca TaxID=29856 RepID=A0A0B7JVE8_BIOOC
MRVSSVSLLLAWVTTPVHGSAGDNQEAQVAGTKNIAIIGAGAAGSSAAYHLQKYAEQENFNVNVTVFEKSSRIGGRTLTVNAFDSPALPVELGASIFVNVNHIMYNATRDFNLSVNDLGATLAGGDITAIWDGKTFVYQSISGQSWWWDAAKMFWKYGTSPYYAIKMVNRVVGSFLKLYEKPYFPFRSLTQRVYELELASITSITGEQLLRQNKINPDFSRDIIQAATRVNYASNLAYIHGLETMVSFATDGAVQILGGNWQIFDNMIQSSKASVYKDTAVTSISLNPLHDASAPKYQLSTKDVSSEQAEEYPVTFDKVIIASPWQFSNISAQEGVIRHSIDTIPYTKLHVTLFTSPFSLRPGFFGLEPGSKAPSTVYTTLGADEEPHKGAEGVGRTGFYSISTLRTVINPKTAKIEYLYKIFSAEAVSASFLSDILGAKVPETFTTVHEETETKDAGVDVISWYYPHWFYSYPIELPRVTFQDPIIGDGLYYTSGIESFISTMETSALMGMNVARLIADDITEAAGEKKAAAGDGGETQSYSNEEL